MKAFCLAFFFHLALLGEAVFHLPLKIHNVPKKKLEPGHEIWANRLHKYGQTLMESKFENDYITGTISIGTPKQNYTVEISSGTSRLWVFSAKYTDGFGTQNLNNASASNTSIDLNKRFSQMDGSFKVEGNYFADEINFNYLNVVNQSFGAIEQLYHYSEYPFFPVDGAIGLNHFISSVYKSGSENIALIDNLLKDEDEKIYTVYLSKYQLPSEVSFQTGVISFGAFDTENCYITGTKEFKLTANTNDNRYVINMNSFNYGSDVIIKGGTAFLDTGISTIWLEYYAFQDIVQRIKATYDFEYNLYTYKCSQRSELNPMEFFFEDEDPNNMVALNPEDYIIDIGMGNNNCALMMGMKDGEYTEDLILGNVFMRKVCTKVDIAKNTVSFHNHV